MYFTDRGIEELADRRGEEEVSLAWLAERLREFVDDHPEAEAPSTAWPAGWPGSTTTSTTSSSRCRLVPGACPGTGHRAMASRLM